MSSGVSSDTGCITSTVDCAESDCNKGGEFEIGGEPAKAGQKDSKEQISDNNCCTENMGSENTDLERKDSSEAGENQLGTEAEASALAFDEAGEANIHGEQKDVVPDFLVSSPAASRNARFSPLKEITSLSSRDDARDSLDVLSQKSRASSIGLIESSITVKGIVYTDPKAFAERLYKREGFSVSEIARFLSKKSTFGASLAMEYLNFFDFTGFSIDEALRQFLDTFCLNGETHEKARIIERFADRYYENNADMFKSLDAVNTLAFSVVLLNTDLHNVNVERKMTLKDFIRNNKGLNDGNDFSKEMLKKIFTAIKKSEIKTPVDEESYIFAHEGSNADLKAKGKQDRTSPGRGKTFLGKAASAIHIGEGKKTGNTILMALAVANTAFTLNKEMLDSVDVTKEVDLEGQFLKKDLYVSHDKRATSRSWKGYYGYISDSVLLFRKSKQSKLREGVILRHAFAEVAGDYDKRRSVFRVYCADGHCFMLQAESDELMLNFVKAINNCAALHSRPPLSSPVGSYSLTFRYPLLPTGETQLNVDEQCLFFDRRLEGLRLELDEHRKTKRALEGKGKSGMNFYLVKEKYLYHEIARYSVYCKSLKSFKGEDEEVVCAVASQSNLSPDTIE